MNTQKQFRMLISIAILLLLISALSAGWLGRLVLDPSRLVDVKAKGSSALADPKTFFKNPVFSGEVGKPVAVAVLVDNNGGSLANVSTELRYSPLDMEVALSTSPSSICTEITRRDHDAVSGQFVVSCTAPSGAGTSQVSPMVTFTVTPRRPGTLPLELMGRSGDYAAVVAR